MKLNNYLIPAWILLVICFHRGMLAQAQEYQFDEAIMASRKAVEEMMANSQTPGCQVAVSVEGKLVWNEGFGLSNLATREKVDTKTLFGIGSISKSLTCAALLKLADQEKLDIESPLKAYLTDFPHDQDGITPRSVAAHLSGLDDAFDRANRYCKRRFDTTNDALKEIYREKLISVPGSQSHYSTGSYTLLAGVIEQATDRNYLSAMQEVVFDPLQLATIVPNRNEDHRENRTEFYELDGALVAKAKYFDPSFKMAGAGFLATASDLVRFTDQLVHSEYLSTGAKKMMFTNQSTSEGLETGFGLGWRIATDDVERLLYHQPGGGPGISTWVFHFPEQELTVAILANLTAAPVGGKAGNTIFDSFLDVIDPK